MLAAGEPVARLLETTRLEVRVGVATADAHAISIGSEQVILVAGRRIRAQVRSVLPERGRETRAVDVILVLAEETRGLRDGDLAELSLRSSVTATGVWLPIGALSEGTRGLWSCFVVEPLAPNERFQTATHRLARRHLEVLHEQSDRVFVRGTLREGERVVVGDTQRLVVGQDVQIVVGEV